MDSTCLVVYDKMIRLWFIFTIMLVYSEKYSTLDQNKKTIIVFMYFTYTQILKGYGSSNIKPWLINTLQNTNATDMTISEYEARKVFWEYHIFGWSSYIVKMIFLINNKFYILIPQFIADTVIQSYSLNQHMSQKKF